MERKAGGYIMTEENRDNGRSFSANEVSSKHWLVPILLLIVRQWGSYGYVLLEQLSTFGFAALNPGTCYRKLRQMEKDGMVSSHWETSESGPARRIYAITEAGEAYLIQWAQSLEQYQRMMETFLHLYTAHPTSKMETEHV
jgi:PadR family transcriptional regulator, regulatory protein PadR